MKLSTINDIYIIDDLLSPAHVEYLEKLYTESNIDWRFQEDITYRADQVEFDEVSDHNYGFSNLIQSTAEHVGTPLFHTAAPIMFSALHRLGLQPHLVMQVRSFLQLPIIGQNNKVNNPHVDLDIPHVVVLYYLTDSDGDTIIYNETEKSKQYTIKDRITPKKGRCVIFDGSHYHSSSQPTNALRAVININVICNRA